ncbi:MAG TPA: hypothetical protein VF215_00450 [Thermoanaerobaculia bacterium]
MKTTILLAALLGIGCSGNQTSSTPAPATTTTTMAVEADVPGADSIRALIRDVYDVISGPAGQERDWDRMRSLFAPNARLSAMVPRRQNDTISTPHPSMVIMSVEDWIRNSGPFLLRDGFFEVEVFNEIERYGNVAHVWSTYESRTGSPDSEPFDRGINSFQLVYGEGRWWVWNILWHSERAGAGTIPDRYLD